MPRLLLVLIECLIGAAIVRASTGNSNLTTDIKAAELNHDHNHILSRKRRYLIFPEGSSFQVVYDDIIGVVDYTNYLILGVTVALAWELPSKPPSEVIDNLKTKLNDGTFGLSRNDSINSIRYVDKNNKQKPGNPAVTFNSTSNSRRYQYRQQPPLRNDYGFREHRLHNVMWKPDSDSSLDSIHRRYHRSTRYKFYQQIEKYLDNRGVNGFGCILRAICETAQKSPKSKPKSFVGELLRAVFTLPEEKDKSQIHYKHRMLHEAQEWQDSCLKKFSHCKHSMWKADFIL